MNTAGLKQDRRTGAIIATQNLATEALWESCLLEAIRHATISVLFKTLPKFVINIFILLLIEIVADPASLETGFFLMLERCRIVRSDVKTETV